METKLPPRREKLIHLLIAGKSITDIAQELKVNRSTIYDWRASEDFQARFNRALLDVRKETDTGLEILYSKVVKALLDCLESENETVKVKTAIFLIERMDRLKENEKAKSGIIDQYADMTEEELDSAIAVLEN